MASFPRVRVFGLWTALSPLLHTEMEQFDAQLSKALNADEGGTWAPSSQIILGGSGLNVTGPAKFDGEFKVTTEALLQGGATITGGPLAVATNASIQGNLGVDGTLTVAGVSTLDDTTVQGTLNVSSNLDVQGTSHLTGNVTADGDIGCERLAIHGAHEGSNAFTLHGSGYIDGAFTIVGAAQIGGALTLVGVVSIAQPVTPTGSGRVRVKAILGADADTTYNAADAQCIHVPSSSSNTTRTYTIGTTDASDGDRISFSTDKVSKTVVLDILGSNPLTVNLHGSTTGAYRSLELTYIGTSWYITSGTLNP